MFPSIDEVEQVLRQGTFEQTTYKSLQNVAWEIRKDSKVPNFVEPLALYPNPLFSTACFIPRTSPWLRM